MARYRKSKARLLGDLFGRSSIFTSQVNETTSEDEVKFDDRANVLTTDAENAVTSDDLTGYLPKSGGTLTGYLTLSSGTPENDYHATHKSYVDSKVASLVDSAPSTLDTLNELAAALGDDANFSTTVTNSLAGKIGLSNLSVGSEGTASGDGAIAYNNSTGVFTYTPPDLSSYHNTDADVWNAFTFGDGLDFLEGTLTASGGISLTDISVSTASAGDAGLAYNNSTGVFTFTPPSISTAADVWNAFTFGDGLSFSEGTLTASGGGGGGLTESQIQDIVDGTIQTLDLTDLVWDRGDPGELLTSNGDGSAEWKSASQLGIASTGKAIAMALVFGG